MEIKAGTRCGCRGVNGQHVTHYRMGSTTEACQRDAVRMVTVRDPDMPGHKSVGGYLLIGLAGDANEVARIKAEGQPVTHGFAPDGSPVNLLWVERYPAREIPMCGPCADWHEKRLDAEAERMTGQFDAPEAE